MSDDFYLDCKTHNEAVHLTDNKINPPTDKEGLRIFLVFHGWSCDVKLETEHMIDYDNCQKFKQFLIEYKDES